MRHKASKLSAGQGSSEPVAPRIYFFYYMYCNKEHNKKYNFCKFSVGK
jgi:hypothetical protein